jgi:deoxyribodipyrimidine photo-lyase
MPDNIPEGLFRWFEIPELNPQNTLLPESKSTFPWKGGETEAHKRLSYYFFESKSALQYKETRNGLLGPDFSTRFSPFLAHGALSPSIILKKLKEFELMEGANESTYWIYFELLWREYFRVIARKHGPALFYQKGIQNKNLELCQNAFAFLQWCNGETGHPFIDACMTELKHTGWLSNRGRQVVASYLVHHKGIDWHWGAWWFEHLLIDYDPASNWGNWQYVAGIGQDPRGTRVFNPDRQAAMYDPDGRYQSLWLKNKR